MRALVFSGTYLPSSQGGTVRAIEGLVAHFGRQHQFYVLTRDREHGATSPYATVRSGTWQQVGLAHVYYADPQDLRPARVAQIARAVNPDAYYVNSFVSPTFGSLPAILRWVGAVPRRPMIIAPRGELHPAALRLKRLKKVAFLQVAPRLGAYRDVLWQAGNQDEAQQIRSVFPAARIAIARDLSTISEMRLARGIEKKPGHLSIAFLSRITPMKNVLAAVRMVGRLKGDIQFDVYGPVVEPDYYRNVCEATRRLGAHVRVRMAGEVPHDRVLDVLSLHHVFLLPTLGESFGHSILEALLAGCIVITSDQTPWSMLSASSAGRTLPPGDEGAFTQALQECVDMGADEFSAASATARRLGVAALRSPTAMAETAALLQELQVP